MITTKCHTFIRLPTRLIRSNFSLMFMSEVAPSVEFQAIVIGEKLANTYQVYKLYDFQF